MPQFAPDQVTFGDTAGYGAWDIGHMREHLQFVQVLSQKVPAVLIPDFDFLSFLTAGQSRGSIRQTHGHAHDMLNNALGITQVDLADFNPDDQGDFYSWLGYHATNHQQIRQSLGLI
jgi:hypothetical protein